MPFFHMRLSSPSLSVNHAPHSVIWKISYYAVATINFPSIITQVKHPIFVVRNNSSNSSFNIFNRTNPSQALLFMVDVGSDSGGCYKSKCSSVSFEKVVSNRESVCDDCPEHFDDDNDKEWQRRRKIGLANKGRVPWNKGKKHNVETRKRIKQRTIEALRDPQVRKKMSEYPRTHSHQVKVKISSSLRRVWEERLKKKRLSEKFFQSWIESVAVAAKKGGKEQQELDWGSYDKINQETIHQEPAEKTKINEVRAKNESNRKAEERVCKKERRNDNAVAEEVQNLSKRRNEQKMKAKEREDIHKEMKKLTTVESLRLKQRLKKIRKKIPINGAVTSQVSVKPQNTSWEKLDLELKTKGQVRNENPLADQMQVSKTREAESIACKLLVFSNLHTTGIET